MGAVKRRGGNAMFALTLGKQKSAIATAEALAQIAQIKVKPIPNLEEAYVNFPLSCVKNGIMKKTMNRLIAILLFQTKKCGGPVITGTNGKQRSAIVFNEMINAQFAPINLLLKALMT